MRVAAVDIGTNTVLLLVAERRGGELCAVEEHATITRLGQGVDKTGELAPDAIARTTACLDRYGEIVRAAGVERVDVVGTSAMRDARGGPLVAAHVAQVLGTAARTISGEEEARLTFAGALTGLTGLPSTEDTDPASEVTVFDIGGGSTEVVRGAVGADPNFAESFDVGSVRLTERLVTHDPPTDEEKTSIFMEAARTFFAVPTAPSGVVVGIAGTITTLAAVAMELSPYDGARVHGSKITTKTLEEVVLRLAKLPLAERSRVPGLEPKRADVIVAGGLIALAFLARVGASEIVVSDRGVRWGLAERLASR